MNFWEALYKSGLFGVMSLASMCWLIERVVYHVMSPWRPAQVIVRESKTEEEGGDDESSE